MKFSKKFISWSIKAQNGKTVPLKVYAASNAIRSEFRFHINCLEEFLKFIAYCGFRPEEYKIEEVELYTPAKCELVISRSLYDYQEEAMDYLLPVLPRSKLLEFQTGKGKGTTALYVSSKKSERVVIVVSANLMKKWAKEVSELMSIPISDILMIQGSNSLVRMMEDAQREELYNEVIIISSRTMAKYIEYYEEVGHIPSLFKFPVPPQDLFSLIKAGVRITDECHLDFHFFFKLDLYTHIPYSLSMSATLVSSRDGFLDQMYRVMYPKHLRMTKLKYEPYATIYSMSFGFLNPEKISYEQSGMYNQAVFEDSILTQPKILESYVNLVLWTIDRYFYQTNHSPGDKCLIFAGRKEMCTLLTERIKARYPDKDVRRYIGEDPYENVIDSEIRVTTLKSAGAAIDIPDLAYVLCLVLLSSERSNLQAFGRLRKRPEGKKTLFSWLFANNLTKHVENNAYRESVLVPMASVFRYIPTGKIVG